MAQPVITYSLSWGNNDAEKLSGKTFTKPNGTLVDCSALSVTISSSVFIHKFYATSVKDGQNYGFVDDVLVDIPDTCPIGYTGVKIVEYTDRSASTNLTFTINAANHLKSGDGSYRIGLYAQAADGTWNYEYFFLTKELEQFVLSDAKYLMVPVKTALIDDIQVLSNTSILINGVYSATASGSTLEVS